MFHNIFRNVKIERLHKHFENMQKKLHFRTNMGIKKGRGESFRLSLVGGGYLLSHFRSTIGAAGLNFSVRNGKRWTPELSPPYLYVLRPMPSFDDGRDVKIIVWKRYGPIHRLSQHCNQEPARIPTGQAPRTICPPRPDFLVFFSSMRVSQAGDTHGYGKLSGY